MPLVAGEKLGPYEIVAPIGEGGMGAVYRARDTRLGRDVAIKVSSERFSERFEREARAIAALNHPNICHLYDVGASDSGTAYLVMELVEGETLAARIKRGAIPIEEALAVARQIAGALEAAHEKGITHRDLKPGNVMTTADRVVKVLDFGLAKLQAPEASPGGSQTANAENSPTLTLAAMGQTNVGVILGTAAYMSPEQARGKSVDKRADIWAFGVVLYEMATGERLFHGEEMSDILAAVLKEQPDFSKVPRQVRPLLESCLEKDPKKRLRDIGDAGRLLEAGAQLEAIQSREQGERTDAGASVTAPLYRSLQSRLFWLSGAAAVVALAAIGLAFVHFRELPPEQRRVQFQLAVGSNQAQQIFSISPDGHTLAFTLSEVGARRLWVRPLDSLEAKVLPGTEGADYPFWSPDSTQLAFFALGKLKKISLAGGPPVTLCDSALSRGGTWNRDGVIVFSAGPASPLLRVAASGGTPAPIMQLPDSEQGRFPQFLPDGVRFLFSVNARKPENSGIWVGSLDGSAPVHLLPDASNAIYVASTNPKQSGELVFRRDDTLMAHPFDPKTLKLSGEAFPLAEPVSTMTSISAFGAFSASENGALIYRSGSASLERQLIWLDRSGKRIGSGTKAAAIFGFGPNYRDTLSPDGRRVALTIGQRSKGVDIWIEDMETGVRTRSTFKPPLNEGAIWSPDGLSIAFSHDVGGGRREIYRRPISGVGNEEFLAAPPGANSYITDWSPDGKWIAYRADTGKTGSDLWLLPLFGDRKPVPYVATPAQEVMARFSPDSHWMAYVSNESGDNQVYVQAIPASGAKWQISTAGGSWPSWRRDGKELFFVSGDHKMMAMTVRTGASFEPRTPQALFDLDTSAEDVQPTPDGQRFLVNVPAGGESSGPPVTVVLNWQAGLKK